MYIMEEGDDYALEEMPAGYDENESKLVLDFQDVDLERSSLEDVGVALEAALNDAMILANHRMLLATEAAKTSPEILRNAQRARMEIQRRYGMSRGLVVETFHISNLVMAVEEEAKEEKGIFRRMIDAIVNAFKWLWEKIGGFLFGKKEVKEKAIEEKEKKAKEVIVKFEEKSKEGKKPKIEEITDVKVLTAFSHFTDRVTGEKISEMIGVNIINLGKLIQVIDVQTEAYNRLVNVTNNEKALAEHIKDTTKVNMSAIAMTNMSLLRMSKEDFTRLGLKEAEGDDFTEVYGLKNFIYGGEYISWRQRHSGYFTWTADYAKQAEKKAEVKTCDNFAEFSKVSKDAAALATQMNEKKEKIEASIKMAAEASKLEKLTSSLQARLDGANSPQEKEDFKKLMESIREVGIRISKVVISAAKALDSVNELCLVSQDYVISSCLVDFLAPAEPAKDAKADEPNKDA